MWAALATTLGTLLLAPWQQAVTPAGAALLYALAAVVLAISYGTGPAVLAALVGGWRITSSLLRMQIAGNGWCRVYCC